VDASARDFLRRHHPFDRLTPDEMETVARTAATITLPGGSLILRHGGKVSEFLHVVAQGAAHLVREGRVVQELEEGECFGYPSILSGNPPNSDVVASGDTVVYRIPARVFKELLGNRDFAEFFLTNLSQRLRAVARRDAGAFGGAMTTAVGTLSQGQPLTVEPAATVADVARAMRDAHVDVALVGDDPPGILTDHDFRVKVLAEGLGADTPITAVMTRPVKTLAADTPVHGALLYLLEHRIHHLPVTEGDRITGVVSVTDLLRHQTRSPLSLLHRLENLEPGAPLGWYATEVAGMVEDLFEGGLKVAQIGKVFAQVNDMLIHRLAALAESELGPPPCPYAWLVFGSEGRMEQALLTDQDNALAYAEDSEAAAAYFPALAKQVVDNLIAAGFPPCSGGCMATNWNRSLAGWQETIQDWIREPTPDNLMVSSIFFDFRAVAGILDVYEPELIVLAGFMRILSPWFVKHYEGRILNIHPALLPKYPGLNTHQRALDAGDEWHGSTVHFVTEELDGGPRILQGRLRVDPTETADELQQWVAAGGYQLPDWDSFKKELAGSMDTFAKLEEATQTPGRYYVHDA